jgi:hypothetical protein
MRHEADYVHDHIPHVPKKMEAIVKVAEGNVLNET